MTLQKHTAIQTALHGNWESAITINLEILKDNPNDTETLNRLAFAFTVLGRIKDAKNTYQKVLEIDVFNPIALKNLKRLNSGTNSYSQSNLTISEDMFLEEHGKTKIVTLVNPAPSKLLKGLQVGQPLRHAIKRSKIFILNEQNLFIGMFPEDIGVRLIRFIKGGNTYEVHVKSVDQHNVTIFIREKKRVARFKNQPSFIHSDKTHLTFRDSSKVKYQTSSPDSLEVDEEE